jgi:soluble lytic murein transglycosylase-like protein
MVHRICYLTLVLMSVVVTGAAQDRYDRALHERAIRLEPFIVASAKRYGVDARILRAICFVESRYRINVVSPKGARGPMQFMPGTAARYGLHDPHNPERAIDAAARYFRDLLRKFGGRVDLVVAAYNAGDGAVSSFMTGKPLVLRNGRIVNARGVVTGGIPPYAETQRYVRSVLTLVNSSVAESAEKSNRRLRLHTRRGRTLDTFDLSEPLEKFFQRRLSSFIEVQ